MAPSKRPADTPKKPKKSAKDLDDQSSSSSEQADAPAGKKQKTATGKGKEKAAKNPSTPPPQKMKWTEWRDRDLLLLGMERDIRPGEYQRIADSFPEKPTAKAVQERLTKLRKEHRKSVAERGLDDGRDRSNVEDPKDQATDGIDAISKSEQEEVEQEQEVEEEKEEYVPTAEEVAAAKAADEEDLYSAD